MRHLGTKKIETERLILRRFTLEDAEKMYANWASDAEVTKYLTWQTHDSVEMTQKVLAEWVANYENEAEYNWCITLKESGEPLGSISAVRISERAELVEVGYCIGSAYWNQGITSEALKAVMDFFFTEVGVNRVESRHDKRNVHSGDVLKKCGMTYEGIRLQGDWNQSGICDVCLYGTVKGMEQTQQKEQRENKKMPKASGQKGAKNIISDETIEYVGILAKLELSDEEKENAKKDMGRMLDYIDKLNELDTSGVEPMSHIFPVNNVLREDVPVDTDGSKDTLANAPEQKDGGFKVPKTIA